MGIPLLKWNGHLAGFTAFKKQWSFFSCSPAVLKQVKNEIKGFSGTSSAIHFTPDKPIPASLIRKMVKLRAGEIRENLKKKDKLKSQKKAAKKNKRKQLIVSSQNGK